MYKEEENRAICTFTYVLMTEKSNVFLPQAACSLIPMSYTYQ